MYLILILLLVPRLYLSRSSYDLPINFTDLLFQIIVPKDLGLCVSYPDGRREKVDALNTDTVADLKSKIHSADGGLPTYKQKLVVSIIEPVREKTNSLGSDQVRHKPGCTVTEDGQRMEILDLERRGIVLSV